MSFHESIYLFLLSMHLEVELFGHKHAYIQLYSLFDKQISNVVVPYTISAAV